MATKSDRYFVKAAVKHGLMTKAEGSGCLQAVEAARSRGEEASASDLAIRDGLVPEKVARRIVKKVGEHLRRKREPGPDDIEGYRLEDRLGEGSMGIVYRARKLNLDKTVALKVLLPKYARDGAIRKRFLREAKAAARLQHPNVAQAFDVGSSNGFSYIVMEHVPGGNLKELFKATGPVSERRALEIARDVTRALQHAREHGIVHRDIKPANIFLTSDGQAKLGDFGLVREVALDSSLTMHGKAVGTPYYMAPEQALQEEVDHRADLYALGATLYHVMTGTVPFDGPSPTAVTTRACQEGPRPDPRDENPDISRGAARLIRKLMRVDPEKRIQEPGDVARAIDGLLAGEGFSSSDLPRIRRRRRKGSGRERTARRGRHTSLVAGGLAAGILGLGLIVGLGFGGSPAATGTDGTETARAGQDAPPASPEQRTDEATEGSDEETGPTPRDRSEAESIERRASEARQATAEARERLDALLGEGLPERAARYPALLADLEEARQAASHPRARQVFDGPIADLRNEMDAILRQARRRAETLVAEGRPGEAARVYHDVRRTQPESTRSELASRIEELEAEAEARRAELRRAEMDRYDDLLAEVATLSREHDVSGAREVLAAALSDLETDEVRTWVEEDRGHLVEAGEFLELTIRAFRNLEGRELSLPRREGDEVSGRVAGARDGEVRLEVQRGVEVGVRLADLAPRALLRTVRDAFDGGSPLIDRKYGLYRLYQGAVVPAITHLDRAADAGEGPAVLARASTFERVFSGESRVADASDAADEETPSPGARREPAPAAPDDGGDEDADRDDGSSPAASDDGGDEDVERDRFIAMHIDELFDGEVMFYDPETHEVEVRYGFVFDHGSLPAEDWIIEGEQPRYDAGARALKFEGSRRRLVHRAVFLGEARLSIDLSVATSFGRDAELTPFAVARGDARRQVRAPFGMRTVDIRGGRPAAATRMAGSPRDAFGSGSPSHQVELNLSGGRAHAALDGDESRALPVEDLVSTPVHVGVEYRRINLEVEYITVRGRLDPDWAAEQIRQSLDVRAEVSPRSGRNDRRSRRW